MATNALSYQWGEELRTGLNKDEKQFCVFAFLTAQVQDFSNILLLKEGYTCVVKGLLQFSQAIYQNITSETLHSNLQWMYGNNSAAPCKQE